jgi:hypothetical protein
MTMLGAIWWRVIRRKIFEATRTAIAAKKRASAAHAAAAGHEWIIEYWATFSRP